MDTMIETKDVTRSFPVAGEEDIQVLKGISIEVPKGEFVILRGRSGSGKTTLMNILGALDTPTSFAISSSVRPHFARCARIRSFNSAKGIASF